MRNSLCALVSLSAIFALAAAARADEIRLKDGSKIIGNVVGLEDGSFKVETAYGFAMIRKDSIAEIIPNVSGEAKQPAAKAATKPAEEAGSSAAKPSASALANSASSASTESKAQSGPRFIEAAESKSTPAAVKSTALTGSNAQPAVAKQPSQPGGPAAQLSQPQAQQQPAAQANSKPIVQQSATVPANTAVPATAVPATPVPMTASAPASSAAASTAPTAAPGATADSAEAAPIIDAPPATEAAPEPPPVREMVRGNLYFNQTYGFQMFRAPDWEPIVAARAALPNAIAALGTGDQSTLLIIGRDRAHDSLEAQSAATEKRVQEIYQNYRPLPPQRMTVAGAPAIERQFRGAAEHHDWAVTVVTFERDGNVFTILAMTDANSEFVQMEQNVIAKAVASLQFTTTFSESTARKLPPSLDDSR